MLVGGGKWQQGRKRVGRRFRFRFQSEVVVYGGKVDYIALALIMPCGKFH